MTNEDEEKKKLNPFEGKFTHLIGLHPFEINHI